MKLDAIDIYDKNKEKTGKIKIRYIDSLKNDEFALAVKAIIINSKQNILISRRSMTKKINPGKWEINGGSCLAGETSLQGVIREIKEELGIDLSSVKGTLYKEYCEHPFFYDIWLFKLDIEIDQLKFLDAEVIEAKWASIENIIQMEKEHKMINYENLNSSDYKECINILFNS